MLMNYLGSALLLVCLALPAVSAPKWDGRVSLRTLYSADDSEQARQILISFLDLDLDGTVGFEDLVALLAQWGFPCHPCLTR